MSRAARGFATEVGTLNVKQVNEDPRKTRSAVDYLNDVLIAYPGRGYLRSCTPSSILPFRGTLRPRGALASFRPDRFRVASAHSREARFTL